jgi:hypothetical protein
MSGGDITHRWFASPDVFLVTKIHGARSAYMVGAASEGCGGPALYWCGCTLSKSCGDQGQEKTLLGKHGRQDDGMFSRETS